MFRGRRGSRVAGAHDPDTVGTEFAGQDPGERLDCRRCDTVTQEAATCQPGARRRQRQDHSRALLRQVRGGCAADDEQRLQVAGDRGHELLDGEFSNWWPLDMADADRIDEDVESPGPPHHVVQVAVDVLLICGVDRGGFGSTAVAGDVAHDPIQCGARPSGDVDVRAFAREDAGDCAAHHSAAAVDDSDLVIQKP